MANKMRVGLIGTGFGTRVQMPGFLSVPDVEVVAICSAQKARAEAAAKEFNVPLAFDDYTEMARLPDLDVVSVCTPPDLHRPMTLAALQAGKHVLCEKPTALNVAEVREMLAEADKRGLVHAVNHVMRYNPSFRHVMHLSRDGYIGELKFLVANVHTNYGTSPSMEPYYYGWLSHKNKAGGALNGLMSHYVDLIRFWFGDFDTICGRAAQIIHKRPVLTFEYRDGDPIGPGTETIGEREVETDDTAVFTGVLKSGAAVTLTGSWSIHHPPGIRVEAYGDEGTLVLDPSGKLLGGRKSESGLAELTIPPELALPEGMPANVGAFALLAQDLAQAIQGGHEPIYATLEDGLRVQEVIDTVLAGPEAGWVKLPLG